MPEGAMLNGHHSTQVSVLGPMRVGKTTLLAALMKACLRDRRGDGFETRLVQDDGIAALTERAMYTLDDPSAPLPSTGTISRLGLSLEVRQRPRWPWQPHHSSHLNIELIDGPGGDVFTPPEQSDAPFDRAVCWAAQAGRLVLCFDASDPDMATHIGSLARVLQRLSKHQPDAPHRVGFGWRPLDLLAARLRPAEAGPSGRFLNVDRVLIALTKVDQVPGRTRGGHARFWVDQMSPVGQAHQTLGVEIPRMIRRLVKSDCEVGVALTSAWGFCPLTGRPFLEALGDPCSPWAGASAGKRIQAWDPYGVRDALIFLATGRAQGAVARIPSTSEAQIRATRSANWG